MGKPPSEVELPNTIEGLKEIVGGRIETKQMRNEAAMIVCNEEGKFRGLPLNRGIYDEKGKFVDVVAGDFLICGFVGEDFSDLAPEYMEKYKEMYKQPEKFYMVEDINSRVVKPLDDTLLENKHDSYAGTKEENYQQSIKCDKGVEPLDEVGYER